nr:MAG TPA: hypothetical protein [Caudoviricetes sp.]
MAKFFVSLQRVRISTRPKDTKKGLQIRILTIKNI